MTGRMVVGIDGSQASAQALEWAVGRARLGGEEVQLVNAYTMTPALDFYGYAGVADQSVEWITDFSRQLLDAAAGRVRELAPDLTCTTTSELGHPGQLLTALSDGATAVVVGRRGLGSAASALLGSVINRLTTQAQCPVVVVGEDDLPTTGPVVVGVDGSEFGANALRYAVAEAALRGTTVRAVAAYDVVHPAFATDPEMVARMRAEVEAEAGAGIDAVGGEVERVVAEGRPADVILANAADAQLVVVGTHGKGLVRRVLLGSVSRQVLNDADRPVAVVDLPEQ